MTINKYELKDILTYLILQKMKSKTDLDYCKFISNRINNMTRKELIEEIERITHIIRVQQ